MVSLTFKTKCGFDLLTETASLLCTPVNSSLNPTTPAQLSQSIPVHYLPFKVNMLSLFLLTALESLWAAI